MKANHFITALFCVAGFNAFSQGCEDTPLPYFEEFESATAPELPGCTFSTYSTFGSSEIFETSPGPVAGFTNKVAQYDTASASGNVGIGCMLYAGDFTLTQGESYNLSVKYGKSQVNAVVHITIFVVTPEGGGGFITLADQNLPAGNVDFTQSFTAGVTGSYQIAFDVHSDSNSGFVYIDDIKLEAEATAGFEENKISELLMYPNPVKDILTINHADAIERVELYSSTGQLLLAEKPDNVQALLNLERLSAGVYYASISSGGLTKKVKIIKE